jgi:hypothetical protein
MSRTFDDVAECVESTLGRVGPHIVLALPLRATASAVLSRGAPANLSPYLERMALHNPRTRQEWLWQRLFVQELRTML